MRFTIATLFITLIMFSCDSYPEQDPDDSFLPVEFQGDVKINDSTDFDWLNDFYYSGYNTIMGHLIIENRKNLNLSTLANIEIVTGHVYLGEGQHSIDFLSKLRHVGRITLHVDSVESLEPLTSLEFVEHDFIISGVASLKENTVFPRLDTI